MSKILFIHHVSFMGGAERYLLSLVEALDQKFKVFFICQEPGPLSEALSSRGAVVEYMPLKAWRKPCNWIANFLTTRKIIQFCKTHQIDLICSNNYRVSSYAVIPAKALKLPAVTIIQDFEPDAKFRKFNALKSDMLITVSDSLSNTLRPYYLKKIERIYNGLDFNAFVASAGTAEILRQEFPILTGKRVIGMIAQVVPGKGHKVFLNAMVKITEDFADVMFVVIGDSSSEQLKLDDIKAHARKLGIDNRVIFTGARPDVAALLKSFDVLVHPAYEEPFGRVVMEAMALSVPVVATRCGGPAEIVEGGQTGFLVAVADEARISKAVSTLLIDESKRKAMGENGHERIEAHFSLNQTVTHINHVLDEALAK